MPRSARTLAAGLVVGTIVSVAWLGPPLGVAVGVVTALLYLGGDALAGSRHGSAYMGGGAGGDRFWALRGQLAKRRDAYSNEVQYDEDAWARARERRERERR
jgi:hypothetical protein